MNSWRFVLEDLRKIIKEASDELSTSERAGLYACARILLQDLRDEIPEIENNDYASEKFTKAKSEIGKMFGFDNERCLDIDSRRSWALGDLSVLESILDKRCVPDDCTRP